MRLALYTDYALRVLIYLVSRHQRATIGEIAEFFAISKDHVAKVVQRMARVGWIRSVRGVGGGLELARSAEEIAIGEVIAEMEGSTHLLECVGDSQIVCVIQPQCKLKGVLAEAERRQMEYLRSVRLSDVAAPGRELIPLSL
jgi:Rrf2 family nitric oxide-sensitive transcriptional repressor